MCQPRKPSAIVLDLGASKSIASALQKESLAHLCVDVSIARIHQLPVVNMENPCRLIIIVLVTH